MEHLAIMDKKTIDMIICGEKKIESRFSKKKIAPYHMIKVGDIVYLKESGGLVQAMFAVKKVAYFDNLSFKDIEKIEQEYNSEIKANDDYWNVKKDSKYGTLIWVSNPQIIPSFSINKSNRQAFISFDGNIKEKYIK